jgi:Ni/Fe-hydrogenase 1 B-type cytochrome subunit
MKNVCYNKVERMTAAMRIIHWANAIFMIVAIFTGFYIAGPYYQALVTEPAVHKYLMAWNRLWHFIAAIIFDVTSIIVVYLYFFSRFEKSYKKLIPTAQNLKEFKEVFLNLITLNRRKTFDSSHSDSFNTVYFTIFHLLLIFMLFTGLQLYVVGLESGVSSIGAWWPWLLHVSTDWTIPATGGDLMTVRIAHHITMWFIIVWVVFHIYYQIWRTIFWEEGDLAIVVGGSKYVKEQK